MKYITGIRPTGRIHIGNYLGAIKHGKELGSMFFVADLHADEKDFHAIGTTLQQLKNLGLVVELESWSKAEIFSIQHEISKYVGVGRLERMTQYKDKSETEQATLKLLSYPVLMAADIFHFGGTHIPVGADQIQHIEFARNVCDILAHNGINYEKPEAVLSEYPRIMSLTDGTKKMSKSLDDGCIYIDDKPDVIRHKIMNAKTAMDVDMNTPEMQNLRTIHRGFGGDGIPVGFKHFKEELAHLIITEFST